MFNKIKKFIFIGIAIIAVVLIIFNLPIEKTNEKLTVKIAVPYNLDASNIPNSYYMSWLEEQTGINIEFEYISQTYTNDYLKLLFSSNTSDIDAVLFAKNNPADINELEMYFDDKFIEPINNYIGDKTYLNKSFEEFKDYDLETVLQYDNDLIYYMPSLTLSQSAKYLQTTWINVDWLENVGLEIPKTTDELTKVLTSFKETYPNAVPIIGSFENESTFICNYLLNSFTICDPENYYFAVDDNKEVFFSPMSEQWRNGLAYCNELYEKGLLIKENFTYSEDEMMSLINDPANCVGMFCSKSLSDMIFENSPQLLSYFLVCSPLNSGYTTIQPQMPEVGGFILSSSKNKELAFKLLDFMCSKEAYLTGHFGEYEIDWVYSSSTDISVFGEHSRIKINSTDSLNRNPNEENIFGPFITDTYYADYVTWNGYQVNQDEYLQARAFSVNQNYEPEYYLGTLDFSNYDLEKYDLKGLSKYIKANIKAFTTGEIELNHENWNEYLNGIDGYNIDEILNEITNNFNGG